MPFAVPQVLLDKSTPHITYRWIALAALLLLYGVRVYFLQGCGCLMQMLQTLLQRRHVASASCHAAVSLAVPSLIRSRCKAAASSAAPLSLANRPATTSRPACSFYIVTYALAIYMLNLLLGFLRWGQALRLQAFQAGSINAGGSEASQLAAPSRGLCSPACSLPFRGAPGVRRARAVLSPYAEPQLERQIAVRLLLTCHCAWPLAYHPCINLSSLQPASQPRAGRTHAAVKG